MIRTITPIFSIIIALVIFFFYTQPQFELIKQVQGQTEDFEEAASKAKQLNDELSRKLSEKRNYPPEVLKRLDALVPTTIDEVRILNDVSEIARKYNMLFGNIDVANNEVEQTAETAEGKGTSVSYDSIASAEIEFSLIGTYEQFKSFLADLEQSLVMLEVTNINFTTGEGSLQQYSITARVFALPPLE